MRKKLLMWLSVSLFFPAVAVVVLAWVGMVKIESAIARVTMSYVSAMAENMAERIHAGANMRGPFHHGYMPWMKFLSALSREMLLPGQLAVIDSSGRYIAGSPGAGEILAAIWRPDIPIAKAAEATDAQGRRYTVAIYPVNKDDLYVVACVSWDELLGPVLQFSAIWPFVAGFVGILSLLSAVAFLKLVVRPLRRLCEEVSLIKWGDEALKPAHVRFVAPEILTLRRAISELAQSAIERTSLTKRYVSDLIRVQEEERSYLSREIHDSTVQAITALIQRIRLARMEDDGLIKLDKHLAEAEDIAKGSIKELRELCDRLDPPWLDLGFEHAITELAGRLQEQLGIVIKTEFLTPSDFDRVKTLALFRITQEAVNNAVQHGGAKTAKIILEEEGGKKTLIISDDGRGFDKMDLKELQLKGHRGLSNMYERAQLIGAHIEIISKEGEGAKIICVL